MRKVLSVVALVFVVVVFAFAQSQGPYYYTLVVRNAITNNGTLAQVGTSVFTGGATFNGAISSNAKIVEDDSLRVEGPVTVNGSITMKDTLKFGSSGLSVLYVKSGGANGDTLFFRDHLGNIDTLAFD
jgi:hypothetical protein